MLEKAHIFLICIYSLLISYGTNIIRFIPNHSASHYNYNFLQRYSFSRFLLKKTPLSLFSKLRTVINIRYRNCRYNRLKSLQKHKLYTSYQNQLGISRPIVKKWINFACRNIYTEVKLKTNRISRLFGIKYPVVQGGMVWCSGWRLASAVSNAGGLGLLGAGSMHPDVLCEHIRKCRAATDKPFGVNVPLMYPEIDHIMHLLAEEGVKIVFTSAGNPKLWTGFLKEQGITVAHVVSNSRFAVKCEEAGVDAVVAEGFEAGGHNGREETTTLCLIPAVRRATSLPLLAAGGIGTGEAIRAVQALGADGVQIGTRFALTKESSAHENFKRLCLNLNEGDTRLLLKKISPTRLVKGDFAAAVEEAEARGASAEELRELIGRGRAKKGIFEGNLTEGELEIGQVASLFRKMQTVEEVMAELVSPV
jgi:enoyl-[acyl-carrier protein] reductase II